MGKLTDWIKKNAKEGADIAEAEKLVEQYSIEGIDTKEKALNFLKSDKGVFSKALHSANTEAIKSHDEKFESEKLPGLLKAEREKALAEANPEMTDEQKALKEANDKIDALTLKDKEREFKSILRKKGEEFKFSAEESESYSVFGEKAQDVMKTHYEKIQSSIKDGLENVIKERFGNNPPPEKTKVDISKQIDRSTYDSMTPEQKSAHFQNGGTMAKE